ncbi:hypothetical protein AB0C93_37905 [Streptomyces sp. NPDC048518]|uniref:hypothetical protein n=1 Tax=Streptomyces sp. NPDC048518 TaxID=3155029 RepID=UPI0033C916D2
MPEHQAARVMHSEMNPHPEREWPRDLVRVPPQGRLREAHRPERLMIWTMPAGAPELPVRASLNVRTTLTEWGVSLADAAELGAEAGRLSEAAADQPGARQAVILAMDGDRITLGVATLTRQTLDSFGDPQDPGLIQAVQGLPSSSGTLELPDARALFTVVEAVPFARRGPSPATGPR